MCGGQRSTSYVIPHVSLTIVSQLVNQLNRYFMCMCVELCHTFLKRFTFIYIYEGGSVFLCVHVPHIHSGT